MSHRSDCASMYRINCALVSQEASSLWTYNDNDSTTSSSNDSDDERVLNESSIFSKLASKGNCKLTSFIEFEQWQGSFFVFFCKLYNIIFFYYFSSKLA